MSIFNVNFTCVEKLKGNFHIENVDVGSKGQSNCHSNACENVFHELSSSSKSSLYCLDTTQVADEMKL